jgi:hypothetical protein
MVTVTHRVGKLVAIRIQSPVTYREATMLRPRMETVLGRMSTPVWLACDLSDARVYSPDVAEKIVSALQTAWPNVRRVGVVINPGSALGGQVFSMFRELDDPNRQAWVRSKDMVGYLAEVLAPLELQSLRDFLDEANHASAMSAK